MDFDIHSVSLNKGLYFLIDNSLIKNKELSLEEY